MQYTQKFKQDARQLVAIALAKGFLKRQPCEKCGEQEAQAHHPDYSKPLDVVWLCHKHHAEIHKGDKRVRKPVVRKPVTPTQIFGAKVRALRQAQRYSQEGFGDLCGLDRTYIGDVERGGRNLSLLTIHKIAKALGIPAYELLK